jgi:hypothetical protein
MAIPLLTNIWEARLLTLQHLLLAGDAIPAVSNPLSALVKTKSRNIQIMKAASICYVSDSIQLT